MLSCLAIKPKLSARVAGPQASANNLGLRAHAHGLLVHPYTFRDDASLLADRWNNQPELEYKHFIANENIDGAFTDYPGTLSAVLQQRAETAPSKVREPIATIMFAEVAGVFAYVSMLQCPCACMRTPCFDAARCNLA